MTIGCLVWTSEHFVFQIVLALICVHQIEVLLQVLTQAERDLETIFDSDRSFPVSESEEWVLCRLGLLAKFCATGALGMRPPGRNCTTGTGGGDSRPKGLKATFGFGWSSGLFSGSESEDEDSLDLDLDLVSIFCHPSIRGLWFRFFN